MTHRSYLFVPGDRPERFDKAVAAGADVPVLDLEDAVLPDAKGRARSAIRDWLSAGGRAAVRVNGIGSAWHEEDVALLAPHHEAVRALDLLHLAEHRFHGLPAQPVKGPATLGQQFAKFEKRNPAGRPGSV